MGSRFLLSDWKWPGNGCTLFMNIAYEALVAFYQLVWPQRDKVACLQPPLESSFMTVPLWSRFLLCFFSFQTSAPVVMVLRIFRVILYFNVYSWKVLMSCLGVSTLLPVEPFIPAASRLVVPVSQFRVNE